MNRRTRRKVPLALGRRVRQQARQRCGYCLASEILLGMPLEFEHLLPVVAGGLTIEENLWLACRRCNHFKGAQIQAFDPQTGAWVALFNPRLQRWHEHFGWSKGGTQIIGKSACGRATVFALNMNNPEIVATRGLWVSVGWWPPSD